MTDRKPEPVFLPFEAINATGCPPTRFLRAPVPCGWILLNADDGTFTHVPDPAHAWAPLEPIKTIETEQAETRIYAPTGAPAGDR